MARVLGFTPYRFNAKELLIFEGLIKGLPSDLLDWYEQRFIEECYRKKHWDEPLGVNTAAKMGIMRRELEARGVRPIRLDLRKCPKYRAEKRKQVAFWKQWAKDNNRDFDN